MGYEVFVYKFENGDAASFPEGEVERILGKYGTIEEGNFGLEFLSNVGDVCDYASLSKDDNGEIVCVHFSRPTTNEKLRYIIFDLLEIDKTCFFGPDLEFMLSRTLRASDMPESLVEHFPDGPQIVTKPGESWPLS